MSQKLIKLQIYLKQKVKTFSDVKCHASIKINTFIK